MSKIGRDLGFDNGEHQKASSRTWKYREISQINTKKTNGD